MLFLRHGYSRELVTPVATGQWPLHCHILYHFEAGMFRTLRVLPRGA